MNTSGVFLQMLFLFIIIMVGFAAAKFKFITTETNTHISRLLAFVTSPMQILSSVLKPGNHPIKNVDALILVGLSFVFYGIVIAVSFVLRFILRTKRDESDGYRFMFIFSNIGYMGYPVIDAIFGVEYRFYATIFVLTFNLFCWTYGVSLLSGERFRITKGVFLRPMVISAMIAFVLYFSKIGMHCPEVLYKAVAGVGDTTSILAMLITGCALAGLSFKSVFGRWRIWILCLIKMFVFPVMFWYLMHFVIKDTLILGVLTIIVSMPVATNATIISYQFGGDEKLASSGVFLSTLVSVISIPILMKLLFGM